MQGSGREDQAKSNLDRPVVGQGNSDGTTSKELRKVGRRPVPVLVPPVPLAPIAPAVVRSATSLSPANHHMQQPHSFHPSSVFSAHVPCHQNNHLYHQQQQQLVPSSTNMPNMAAVASTVPTARYLPTSLIFMNQKLRCGKWAPTEEAYALLLIEYFEKGIILDCENGMTLRSFLSRKLHCSPMRISKKYAGTQNRL